jgi:hypothetical protein
VRDLYIPTIDLHILQQEICGPILGMHKFTLLLLKVAPPCLTHIDIRVLNYLVYFTNVSSHAEACRLEVNKNFWLKNFMSDKTSDYSVWHFLLLRIRVTCRENNFRALNTLQRINTENLKQIFLEKEFGGHSPDFHIHVSVSDLYFPTIDLPILQQEICGPILGIYISLTDT